MLEKQPYIIYNNYNYINNAWIYFTRQIMDIIAE